MTLPKSICFWNAVKGVVDQYSRYMKSFTVTNVAEYPTVAMVARFLLSLEGNAAIAYRLTITRRNGALKESTVSQLYYRAEEDNLKKGHSSYLFLLQIAAGC